MTTYYIEYNDKTNTLDLYAVYSTSEGTASSVFIERTILSPSINPFRSIETFMDVTKVLAKLPKDVSDRFIQEYNSAVVLLKEADADWSRIFN